MCLSGGICLCVYACQDNLGSQTSFNSYKLINVQSCLVWLQSLWLVLFGITQTAFCVLSLLHYCLRRFLILHLPNDQIVIYSWLWWWQLLSHPLCFHCLSSCSTAEARKTGIADNVLLQQNEKVTVKCFIHEETAGVQDLFLSFQKEDAKKSGDCCF